ncbi:MAG: META domain-containing protein [Acidimicrobiia bacterium]|nr:META domain-containing protein [Acidimicrobiia bacterium]
MSLSLIFLLLGAAVVAGATVSFRGSHALIIRSASAAALAAGYGAACGEGQTATGDPLEGTKWEITSVWDGRLVMPANPTTIATLVLTDGTASGSTGCSLFRSAYSIDATSITFADLA